MLCDNDHYCWDCSSWLPPKEAQEHKEIGHQITEAQNPKTVKEAA